MMAMVTEDLLEQLGVSTAGGSDREIRALCPVHALVTGKEDTRPSWYMNRTTGAWLCFSCHQKGSLFHLIELMGGDEEMLSEARRGAMVQTMEEIRARVEDDEPEPEHKIYISEYGFAKNPLPPKRARLQRDIKKVDCERFNLRWDAEGMCFLIPLVDIDTGMLIGWQEKAKGYFMNVPTSVEKSDCLFGFQQYNRGDLIVVESPLDCVRLAQYRLNAVATMGSYVSARQLEAIAEAVDAKHRIILAFDNDDAGHTARDYARRSLRSLSNAPVRCFTYPSAKLGKDPGELPIEAVVAGVERASSIVR